MFLDGVDDPAVVAAGTVDRVLEHLVIIEILRAFQVFVREQDGQQALVFGSSAGSLGVVGDHGDGVRVLVRRDHVVRRGIARPFGQTEADATQPAITCCLVKRTVVVVHLREHRQCELRLGGDHCGVEQVGALRTTFGAGGHLDRGSGIGDVDHPMP